jgi:hypothetical protein
MNKTHRDKETEPPATPKSNVKKRLGWNPKQQLPNEQDSGNSAYFSSLPPIQPKPFLLKASDFGHNLFWQPKIL